MKKFLAILMATMLLFVLALPVAAEISPSPEPEFDVDSDVQEGEGETFETPNEDGSVTITAEPDEDHKFIRWEIEGEYILVSGTLTNSDITIVPLSDIKAHAYFDGDKVIHIPDDDEKSPETGVAEPVMIIAAMLVTLTGAAYSFKKSFTKA